MATSEKIPSRPAAPRRARHSAREQVSPEAYAQFISQINLRRIWLASAHVVNYLGPEMPKQGSTFNITSKAKWEPRPAGFRAIHQSEIRLTNDESPLAEIDVTFGLDFDSKQPVTEAIFRIFSDVNLPVNTWPYVREYVASTMGRMTWVPFTLPALKRGTEPTRQQDDEPRTTAPRRASSTSTRPRRASTQP